jgi:hypothetical protein
MVMHPASSPGTMVIDAMGMVCFIVVPSGPAAASVPAGASVPDAASAPAVASVPVAVPAHDAAPAPDVAPAPAMQGVPAPVVPQLPVTMQSRRDEGDQHKAHFGIREFHVLVHEGHVEHQAFRNTEPTEGSVLRLVAARRRLTKQGFVKESVMYGEYWPRMLLRVKELEHKQSQAAKMKKRIDDQKANRAAARAKAKAKAKAKAAA